MLLWREVCGIGARGVARPHRLLRERGVNVTVVRARLRRGAGVATIPAVRGHTCGGSVCGVLTRVAADAAADVL